MAYILLPDRWGKFPSGPLELDEQHWLVNRGNILLYAPLAGAESYIQGRWRTFATDQVARRGDSKFDAGVGDFNAQYIEHPEGLKTAVPVTLIAWANLTLGTAYTLLSLCEAATNDSLRLHVGTTGVVQAVSTAGASGTASSSTNLSSGEWGFCTARFVSNTSRTAALNGVFGTANTTSSTPSGFDKTVVGGRVSSGAYTPYTGKLANALILNYSIQIGELLRLYAEQLEAPYALLRRKKTRLYFSGVGGVTGTLSATEFGSDTASISGDVLVNGALAATESGVDSAALAGKVLVEGALSASESGADTAALVGDVLVKGALAASESGNDSASFIGEGFVPTATGTLAASESGSDTASIAGKVYIAGTLSAVEGGLDAFAVSGDILVQGAIAASETGDDTAAFVQETLTLTPADLDAIAAAVWADPSAVAAHTKLDAIIARITC